MCTYKVEPAKLMRSEVLSDENWPSISGLAVKAGWPLYGQLFIENPNFQHRTLCFSRAIKACHNAKFTQLSVRQLGKILGMRAEVVFPFSLSLRLVLVSSPSGASSHHARLRGREAEYAVWSSVWSFNRWPVIVSGKGEKAETNYMYIKTSRG